MHLYPLVLLITALAVMRITRLFVVDQITAPIRSVILRRNGETGWFSYLVHCPICFSVWVGAVVAPVYWWWGTTPWFLIPALMLAFSELVIFANKWDIL